MHDEIQKANQVSLVSLLRCVGRLRRGRGRQVASGRSECPIVYRLEYYTVHAAATAAATTKSRYESCMCARSQCTLTPLTPLFTCVLSTRQLVYTYTWLARYVILLCIRRARDDERATEPHRESSACRAASVRSERSLSNLLLLLFSLLLERVDISWERNISRLVSS